MSLRLKPYPEYKDSGVPWLGKIPSHWGINRAKWLFRKLDRPVEPSSEVVTCFRDGAVTLRKYRRIEGFTESLKEIGYQGVCRGDLVVHAMDAFAGAVGVSDSDGKCTPVYAICEPRLDANPYYYARIVREMAHTRWILALAKGIRERSTDFRYEAFADQVVPVPPANEQQCVEVFLSRMDALTQRLMRAKLRMIELLDERKRAIIHQAVTHGLDPKASMKPTDLDWLPEVPEHWEKVHIGSSVRIVNGFPFDSELFDQTVGIPLVRIRDIFSPSTEVRYTGDEVLEARIDDGDVLVGMDGNFNVAIWRGGPALLNQRVCCIRPRSSISREYLAHLLAIPLKWLNDQTFSTTVKHLSSYDIRRLRVFMPDIEEQAQIVRRINEQSKTLDAAIQRALQEIDLIREYRTRLISDVVTGKLDVRDVDLPDVGEDEAEFVPLDPEAVGIEELTAVEEVSHADH